MTGFIELLFSVLCLWSDLIDSNEDCL